MQARHLQETFQKHRKLQLQLWASHRVSVPKGVQRAKSMAWASTIITISSAPQACESANLNHLNPPHWEEYPLLDSWSSHMLEDSCWTSSVDVDCKIFYFWELPKFKQSSRHVRHRRHLWTMCLDFMTHYIQKKSFFAFSCKFCCTIAVPWDDTLVVLRQIIDALIFLFTSYTVPREQTAVLIRSS